MCLTLVTLFSALHELWRRRSPQPVWPRSSDAGIRADHPHHAHGGATSPVLRQDPGPPAAGGLPSRRGWDPRTEPLVVPVKFSKQQLTRQCRAASSAIPRCAVSSRANGIQLNTLGLAHCGLIMMDPVWIGTSDDWWAVTASIQDNSAVLSIQSTALYSLIVVVVWKQDMDNYCVGLLFCYVNNSMSNFNCTLRLGGSLHVWWLDSSVNGQDNVWQSGQTSKTPHVSFNFISLLLRNVIFV